jgi:predicted naringenin-chalcone synthase
MTLGLTGIGTALPEHRLKQSEAVELHATFCRIDEKRSRTLRALYRRCGVQTRHSVTLDASEGPLETRQKFYSPAVDDDDAGPGTAARMAVFAARAPALAIQAARKALTVGSVQPSEVTHLITVSCTGFVSPGVDAELIETLDLPCDVERTHIGFMGCHGALNGLRVAKSFAELDAATVPLVCAVELCSLHFAYGWDPDMLVANALFADGAAAVVGRVREETGHPHAGESSTPWRVSATGTLLMPDSKEEMTWRIGDHGFRMTLSPRVPVLIEAHLRDWLVSWLGTHGLTLGDVGSWAVHPGGPRILSAVEKALDLSRDDTAISRSVLAEHGNMSSPTILFILDRMMASRAARPCVALAFGPGLAVEATLLT